jgi:hypothetical protein
MSSSQALLSIYDDSLHNRWQPEVQGGAVLRLNAEENFGNMGTNGGPTPCGRSLQLILNSSEQSLSLSTEESVVYRDASKLTLSFAFKLRLPTAEHRVHACDRTATRGRCNALACVTVRQRGMPDSVSVFAPLCPTSLSDGSGSNPWTQFRTSLGTFAMADAMNEIKFVFRGHGAAVSQLLLDELNIEATNPLQAGDELPSYGQGNANMMLSSWVSGARQYGAASVGRANSNKHLCEYMTSEMGHTGPGKRPFCRVDGDHLNGRWMQTCDPQTIGRPDLYAYGRAQPMVRGWYDYRLCHRQSASERLRVLQAVSWSWRPKSCALAPVSGEAFDLWLGERTIVMLGDSLTAQMYYSLLWLLGDVVVEQKDVVGVATEDRAESLPFSEHKMDRCESSIGNEGGWLSVATLRSGGRLVKVMRHGSLVDELYNLEEAWWSSWVIEADILVLNVGHHYRSVDNSFTKYGSMAQAASKSLAKMMKPRAQLVFRTTNIGHFGCENATKPWHSRSEAWRQLTDDDESIWGWHKGKKHMNMFKDKYSWRGPPLFESGWADAVHSTAALGDRFTFLNVSFLDLRSDGHVASSMRYSPATGEYSGRWKTNFPLDCLHYCYPGPTDYWALTLYNLLLNNNKFSKESPTL